MKMTVKDFMPREAKCLAVLREMRWPDGVRCAHCESAQVVRDFLAAHPRLVPLWLPKYSSDLDQVEQLWKTTRHCVTHNRFFRRMETGGDAIRAFIRGLPRETVKSVCSMDYLGLAR